MPKYNTPRDTNLVDIITSIKSRLSRLENRSVSNATVAAGAILYTLSQGLDPTSQAVARGNIDALQATNPILSTDIELSDIGDGVILKSPNGTRWRITIADDGSLTTTGL